MAEESKSWFPNLGLLSESSLTGLSPEVQDQLQRESVKRMVIGGLLSGRPDIGFQSAVGVPNDYFARQQQINAQNQLAGISRAAAASTTPTTMGVSAGSPQAQMLEQDIQDFGPDAARTASALYSNPNLPREINKPLYAKNVSQILAATSPKDWAEFEKNVRPQAMEPGSVITDPFNPSKVISQLPGGLEKGMQWGVNPVTGKTEVQLMPGFATGVAERTAAEKGAAARFELKPVIENGREVLRPVSELAGAGQNSALTRAQGDVAALQREISLTKPTETGRLAILNQELQKAQGQVTSLGGTATAPVSKLSAPEAAYENSWEQTAKSARTGYESSKKNAVALQSLQNIFNRPDFGTNAFTRYKSQIISVLQPLGLSTEQQSKFLTSATSARQALNDFAVNNVSELSGATSDRDIIFGKERFATLEDTTAATRYAIDLMEATNNRKKAYFDFVQNNRTNDVEKKWSQSPEGSASIFESPKMRKYLPSNVVKDGEYKGQRAYLLPDGVTVKVFPE